MRDIGLKLGRIGTAALLVGAAVCVGPAARGKGAAERDPVRPDIVAHFSAGTVAVNVNGSSGVAQIDDGEVWLSTNDPKCRPSPAAGCAFTIVKFLLHTEPFSVAGKTVSTMQVRNQTPLFGQLQTDGGLQIPPSIPFLASGLMGEGDPVSVEVNPSVADPANQLDLQFDLDTQQFSISGNLQGTSGSFNMQLAVLATADSPLANLPPLAHAGPDQTVETSCVASVSLDKSQTTDPNGNLAYSYYRQGEPSIGDGSAPVPLPPGDHPLRLVAVDRRGGEGTDDVVIHVRDNGAAPAVNGAASFTLSTPPGVLADQVVLGASGSLIVSDRAVVRAATGGAAPVVVNMGQISTELGADSSLTAEVWSQAPVFMRERASITGSLHASTILPPQNGTVVSGGTTTGATFNPSGNVGWGFAPLGPVSPLAGLEPGQQLSLPPGSYGQLTVKTGAQITLQSGTYSFTGFDIEPQGSVVLTGADPVLVYTSGVVIYRGTTSVGPGVPRLLLLHTGTGQLAIEAPFTGSIIAPGATLQLASSGSTLHRGAFFAANVNVAAGAIVEHVPLSFDFVRGSRTACALTPVLDCVEPTVTGFRARFHTENQLPYSSVSVPVGAFNGFSPGAAGRGQPTIFPDGFTTARAGSAFTVDFASSSLTWTLGARSVTASSATVRCN